MENNKEPFNGLSLSLEQAFIKSLSESIVKTEAISNPAPNKGEDKNNKGNQ